MGRLEEQMNEMLEPNEVTSNILISAYCREGNVVQALVMLEKSFSNGCVPDVITVTKVIEILCNEGRVTEAVEVLERVKSSGGSVDVVAYNTLIKGFSKMNEKFGTYTLMNEGSMPGSPHHLLNPSPTKRAVWNGDNQSGWLPNVASGLKSSAIWKEITAVQNRNAFVFNHFRSSIINFLLEGHLGGGEDKLAVMFPRLFNITMQTEETVWELCSRNSNTTFGGL
ncbi:hypothetical protein C3L33_17886, partial [Rhododendron williamsianum]